MGFSIPGVEKKIIQRVVCESLTSGGFDLDVDAQSAVLRTRTTSLMGHTEIENAHLAKAEIDDMDCTALRAQNIHTDVSTTDRADINRADINQANVGRVCAQSISVGKKIELVPDDSKSIIDMGGIIIGSPKDFAFEETTKIFELFGWKIYSDFEWRMLKDLR